MWRYLKCKIFIFVIVSIFFVTGYPIKAQRPHNRGTETTVIPGNNNTNNKEVEADNLNKMFASQIENLTKLLPQSPGIEGKPLKKYGIEKENVSYSSRGVQNDKIPKTEEKLSSIVKDNENGKKKNESSGNANSKNDTISDKQLTNYCFLCICPPSRSINKEKCTPCCDNEPEETLKQDKEPEETLKHDKELEETLKQNTEPEETSLKQKTVDKVDETTINNVNRDTVNSNKNNSVISIHLSDNTLSVRKDCTKCICPAFKSHDEENCKPCCDTKEPEIETSTFQGKEDPIKNLLAGSIIISAIPGIIFLYYITFRKCKHLYQRRHYRNTNFLIDGGVNNPSPVQPSDTSHPLEDLSEES